MPREKLSAEEKLKRKRERRRQRKWKTVDREAGPVKIMGRIFEYRPFDGLYTKHESGVYYYKGHRIAKEWFDVGYETRWGEYRETEVRRWVITDLKPFWQHNFKSISKAADYIDGHLGFGGAQPPSITRRG